ncbi:unnamed protein product [Gordionus sp. m RMFG-2023]
MAAIIYYSLYGAKISAFPGNSRYSKKYFEAAFQGDCLSENNLCSQICLDVDKGIFECDCFVGYDLAEDGYFCKDMSNSIAKDVTQHEMHLSKNDIHGSSTTTNKASMNTAGFITPIKIIPFPVSSNIRSSMSQRPSFSKMIGSRRSVAKYGGKNNDIKFPEKLLHHEIINTIGEQNSSSNDVNNRYSPSFSHFLSTKIPFLIHHHSKYNRDNYNNNNYNDGGGKKSKTTGRGMVEWPQMGVIINDEHRNTTLDVEGNNRKKNDNYVYDDFYYGKIEQNKFDDDDEDIVRKNDKEISGDKMIMEDYLTSRENIYRLEDEICNVCLNNNNNVNNKNNNNNDESRKRNNLNEILTLADANEGDNVTLLCPPSGKDFLFRSKPAYQQLGGKFPMSGKKYFSVFTFRLELIFCYEGLVMRVAFKDECSRKKSGSRILKRMKRRRRHCNDGRYLLLLYLKNGKLKCAIFNTTLDSRLIEEINSQVQLARNVWHNITVNIDKKGIKLVMSEGIYSSTTKSRYDVISSSIFYSRLKDLIIDEIQLGGLPKSRTHFDLKNYDDYKYVKRGIRGCIRKVRVQDQLTPLIYSLKGGICGKPELDHISHDYKSYEEVPYFNGVDSYIQFSYPFDKILKIQSKQKSSNMLSLHFIAHDPNGILVCFLSKSGLGVNQLIILAIFDASFKLIVGIENYFYVSKLKHRQLALGIPHSLILNNDERSNTGTVIILDNDAIYQTYTVPRIALTDYTVHLGGLDEATFGKNADPDKRYLPEWAFHYKFKGCIRKLTINDFELIPGNRKRKSDLEDLGRNNLEKTPRTPDTGNANISNYTTRINDDDIDVIKYVSKNVTNCAKR